MTLRIPGERTTVQSIQTENQPTQSAASSKQETAQSVDSEKQTTGAKELASAKKFDGQLQAMTLKMQLNTQTSESAPSAYTGGGNMQVLGKSASESQSYAAKSENKSESQSSNSYQAVRKEIAGALGVHESDPAVDETYAKLVVEQNENHEKARIESAQKIVDDARTLGRRIETPNAAFADTVNVTEYIPADWADNLGDTKVYVRTGQIITDGDQQITKMRYLDPENVRSLGYVESVIQGTGKDAKEVITFVDDNAKTILGLNVGDTRDVPPPTTSAAGKVPSSFDPARGNYGHAGQSTNSSLNNSGNSSDAKAEKTDYGERPEHYSSGTSSGSSQSSGSQQAKGETTTTTKTEEAKPEDKPAETPAESEEAEKTNHVHHYHSGPDTGGVFVDEGTSYTVTPHTDVEVIPPEETKTEDKKNEGGYRAGYGDYADIGPEIPSSGSSTIEVAANGTSTQSQHIEGHWNPQGSEGNVDKSNAPVDYGNPYDPRKEAMSTDNMSRHLKQDPAVTDPANPGEEEVTIDSIRTDMAGTLLDGRNPLDPNLAAAPAPNPRNPGDAENTTPNENL
jgi:hypothetical protein